MLTTGERGATDQVTLGDGVASSLSVKVRFWLRRNGTVQCNATPLSPETGRALSLPQAYLE